MRLTFKHIVDFYKHDFVFFFKYISWHENVAFATLVLLLVSLIFIVLVLRPPRRASVQLKEALRVLASWFFILSMAFMGIRSGAHWAVSVVFLFFSILLLVVLIRPLGRSSRRLKRPALMLAAGLTLSGLIFMFLGLRHPSLPVELFYWGYLFLWICLPFWAGARGGATAILVGILCGW